MNEKVFVSKELNARHIKILEGLVKLPENRECADCRSKAPRWASVNLGVFICMQCSGIHRNLGVHISKVRSTTLDTWLPEQVAFMQGMGNLRSNEYWEACLPTDYDRSDVHKFIRAKYEEKRWAPKNAAPPLPKQPAERGGIPPSYYDDSVHHACPNGLPPRKTRNLSLEEGILTQHVATIAPPTRHRTTSMDMKDDATPPVTSTRGQESKNVPSDLFGLLYSRDANRQQPSTRHNPASWATFECSICLVVDGGIALQDFNNIKRKSVGKTATNFSDRWQLQRKIPATSSSKPANIFRAKDNMNIELYCMYIVNALTSPLDESHCKY
ncbi:hypothetical protein MLD38_025105 [Melastoma candidum]|uniref:Uncharacterized protein n=1 Tax=Melastoma candidum TaxID=119954 RepID=A0ACB9NZH3_9MYRT|nr:hypothetical protein MLD38_025105 [Melastoma candidum]